MADSEQRLSRHLQVLLKKNFLLKRRALCSLICELLLAVSATALLALARASTTEHDRELHVGTKLLTEQAMPVRLPDCAEYVEDCPVRLIEGSPKCAKDISFGCVKDVDPDGPRNALWVRHGCHGLFDFGPNTFAVQCGPGPYEVCESGGVDEVDLVGRRLGLLHKMGFRSPRLFFGHGQTRMRRYSAEFGVAPADGGGRAFRDWLVQRQHPWASSVRLFDSAEALEAHVTAPEYPLRDPERNRSSRLCGAVIFGTPPESDRVEYSLRFNSTLSTGTGMLSALKGVLRSAKISTNGLVANQQVLPGGFDTMGILWYTQSGFLAMQRTVDTFVEEISALGSRMARGVPGGGRKAPLRRSPSGFPLEEELLGEDWRPHVVVPFPVAGRSLHLFAMLMPQLLAPFLLISLTYSVNRMITSVVHEREARLRDGMRMMGMHPAAFYMSWFLTYLAIYCFVCLGVTACLSWGQILEHSSASLIFVWLMLFSAASISYALLITSFFTKAKTAATVGSMLFYASSYLHHLVGPSSSPAFVKFLCLFPPVCFELMVKSVADLEGQGIGIVWANSGHPGRHFSTLAGCCMLVVDAAVLLALFLYLDQVLPREIGVRRSWYFPCMPAFWQEVLYGQSAIEAATGGALAAVGGAPDESLAEEEELVENSALIELDVGEAAAMMARNGQVVEVRGLSKTFGSVRAVKGLDLVMYQGEIFALLGHNGAGKTTTLGILCCLLPPSQGSCVVFGHDLGKDPSKVQGLLGVCPQHDVLWDELTCEEHLSLFAAFKGVPSLNVPHEAASMLQRVGLQGCDALRAGRLSGGMKRKLSLGIAFVGASRLVVLDEPTSGLDPYSRRAVWELLRAMKQGRVTVLSTHYMDEADILGDRIAILHEGSLRCSGTPQFLKRAYDCGYNVTLVKAAGCSSDVVREALTSQLPEPLVSEVSLLSDSGNELILQFPFAAAKHFPQVFGTLEQQLQDLCVESYGVSVTTLEEVFLKVASGERVQQQQQRQQQLAAAATAESGSGVPAADAAAAPGTSPSEKGLDGHGVVGGAVGGGAEAAEEEEEDADESGGEDAHLRPTDSTGGSYQARDIRLRVLPTDPETAVPPTSEPSVAPLAGAGAQMPRPEAAGVAALEPLLLPATGTAAARRRRAARCFVAVRRTRALFTKRWRYGLRDRRGLLCQLLLPIGTLLLLLAIMSGVLFRSMPPLELDAAHYNEQCAERPQNSVGFTHLASVQPGEAAAMLEPGRRFWNGDVEYFAPKRAAPGDQAMEEGITSTLPGLLKLFRPALADIVAHAVQLESARARDGDERRLAGEGRDWNAAVRHRLWDAAATLWAEDALSEAARAAETELKEAAETLGPAVAAAAAALQFHPTSFTGGAEEPESSPHDRRLRAPWLIPPSPSHDDAGGGGGGGWKAAPAAPPHAATPSPPRPTWRPAATQPAARPRPLVWPQPQPVAPDPRQPAAEAPQPQPSAPLGPGVWQPAAAPVVPRPQPAEGPFGPQLPQPAAPFEPLEPVAPPVVAADAGGAPWVPPRAGQRFGARTRPPTRIPVAKLVHNVSHLFDEVAGQRGGLPELASNLTKLLDEATRAVVKEGKAERGPVAEEIQGMRNLALLWSRSQAHFRDVDTWRVCTRIPHGAGLMKFWSMADTDHSGTLTLEEFRYALRRQLHNDDPSVVDLVTAQAAFLILDQDFDHKISLREYCLMGASISAEMDHYRDLAKHFSQQLLQSTPSCTRYGAYYVLHGPRTAASPPWELGQDAALFVNTTSPHAAPVFQAALTNARFARNGVDKQVVVRTHPFGQTTHEQRNLEKFAVFFLAIHITFALSFIPAGIVHPLVKERERGARQLQMLSGASFASYWVANMFYDVVLYALPAASVPLALQYFGFNMMLEGDCGLALLAVLVALGPALVGFTYIVSFLFRDASKASNSVLSFCLMGASVLSTVLFVLEIINYDPTAEYPSACDYPTAENPEGTCRSPRARAFDRVLGPLFRLVPTVCVYQALFSIAMVANMRMMMPEKTMKALAGTMGSGMPHLSFSPFAYEWAGEPLVYLSAQAVVYVFVAILLDWCIHSPQLHRLADADVIERRLIRWCRGAFGAGARLVTDGGAEASANVPEGGGEDTVGDQSVEVERERVSFLAPQDVALHVACLEKTYRRWTHCLRRRRDPSSAKHAVRGVSFAVHSGEVFGLLGHNGAGKTSALKCLVGELCCSSGDVHVGGYHLRRQAGNARACIGYCPQFDALLELLTVRDHLELYAALKELPQRAPAQALQDFCLEKMASRRADVLSGGNKRRLSAAIALMGRPRLAVLDEPSCGLDPAARRALWSAVHAAVGSAAAAAAPLTAMARPSLRPPAGTSASEEMWAERSSAVLLTTHSMEEAEALSTRLGILAEGQLLTVGTAQQIKQRHGSSHELALTLAPEADGAMGTALQNLGGGSMELAPATPLADSFVATLLQAHPRKRAAYCRPRCVVRAQLESIGHVEAVVLAEWWLQQDRGEAIDAFLRGLLGDGVELAENFGTSWRFRLPHCDKVGLPELFAQLEANGPRLRIAEYTLTQATLEQIFNNIAQQAEEERQGEALAHTGATANT